MACQASRAAVCSPRLAETSRRARRDDSRRAETDAGRALPLLLLLRPPSGALALPRGVPSSLHTRFDSELLLSSSVCTAAPAARGTPARCVTYLLKSKAGAMRLLPHNIPRGKRAAHGAHLLTTESRLPSALRVGRLASRIARPNVRRRCPASELRACCLVVPIDGPTEKARAALAPPGWRALRALKSGRADASMEDSVTPRTALRASAGVTRV